MALSRRGLLGKSFLALGAGIVGRSALSGPVQAAPNQALALRDLSGIIQNGSLPPEKLERYVADHFREPGYENALHLRLRSYDLSFHTRAIDVTSYGNSPVGKREFVPGLPNYPTFNFRAAVHEDQQYSSQFFENMSANFNEMPEVWLVFPDRAKKA